MLTLLGPCSAEPLPDGLLVSGGGDLRAQAAEWTIVVTIDVVQEPDSLHDMISQVYLAINGINANLTHTTKKAWKDRLQRFKQRLSATTRHRNRRGLLNIIGELAHSLFGVATAEQLEETRDIIEQMKRRSDVFAHSIKELMTVVNATTLYVQENRLHLAEVRHHQLQVQRHLEALTEAHNEAVGRLDTVELRLEMERVLGALAIAVDTHSEELARYRRERAALETGRLTEELLPPEILQEILKVGTALQVEALPRLEWYYESILITPWWGDERTLMYSAKLPLVEPTEYLYYTIQTWPVPYPQGDLSVQLETGSAYGLDTRHGYLFVPQGCMGENPVVCRPGPLYNERGLQCPRGILTNNQEMRSQCEVTVEKGANSTRISQIGLNQYVIVTWGESYAERCSGRPEVAMTLPAGVHTVTVNNECTLNGETWSIRAMIQKEMHLSLSPPPTPDLEPLDLQLILPAERLVPLFEPQPMKEPRAIRRLILNNLPELPSSIDWSHHGGHAAWGVLATIVLGLLAGVAYAIRARWLKFMTACSNSKSTKVDQEKDNERGWQPELVSVALRTITSMEDESEGMLSS